MPLTEVPGLMKCITALQIKGICGLNKFHSTPSELGFPSILYWFRRIDATVNQATQNKKNSCTVHLHNELKASSFDSWSIVRACPYPLLWCLRELNDVFHHLSSFNSCLQHHFSVICFILNLYCGYLEILR